MLIQFGIENHFSIRDYQELLLTAAAIKDEAADLIESSAIKEQILPAAAIYGANGSGKTNVLNGLVFLRNIILSSHSRGNSDSKISVKPFLLDEESRNSPSKFDCEFILNKVRYEFGVVVNGERVIEEYLYSYPKKYRQVWYERNSDVFTFGRYLQGENKAIQKLTRRNSLFLSAAATNNHQQLTPIFDYFRNSIVFYDELPGFGLGTFRDYGLDEGRKTEVLKLLSSADFGIVDIEARPKEETEFSRKFKTDIGDLIKKHMGGRSNPTLDEAMATGFETLDIKLVHKGKKSKPYPLDLAFESRGTQTFLNLLAPVIRALNRGQVLIVDELDTSLHTLLARKILSLFNSRTHNPNGAQLLFTTHDTNLLSPNCIRRDQVWFTERTLGGATKLYPLSDIKVRKDDDFEKGYLQGRYGAVPIIGDLQDHIDLSREAVK